MNYEKYVKVCKRINNTKRNYLVLNEAQCKHVPSSPTLALEMYEDLGKLVDEYKYEQRLLVVGFAETATAIGAGVATYLGCDYVNTTRENFDADFMYFTESHSHATEQKLIRPDLDYYNHVLFVEDEVTTGNTILKIARQLRDMSPDLKVSVVSILNGMTNEHLRTYETENIDIHYLVKLDNSDYSEKADSANLDGSIVDLTKLAPDKMFNFKLDGTRRVVDISYYNSEIDKICDILKDEVKGKSIAVIGTEECMYPAIKFGSYFEKKGINVVSHSTTRSPIGVSLSADYPLHTQIKLYSLYGNRDTYIYNLAKYDEVYIITDSQVNTIGLRQLLTALRTAGNTNITLITLEED